MMQVQPWQVQVEVLGSWAQTWVLSQSASRLHVSAAVRQARTRVSKQPLLCTDRPQMPDAQSLSC